MLAQSLSITERTLSRTARRARFSVNQPSFRGYSRVVRPIHAAIAEPQKTKAAPLSVKDVFTSAQPFHVLKMDKPSYYNGRAFADTKELKDLARGIRRYAEFCKCTYNNYLAVRKDGRTPIPSTTLLLKNLESQKDPGLLQQIIIAATGTQEEVDKYTPLRTPALPEDLFLAPSPAFTPETLSTQTLPPLPASYTYTDAQLGGQYGFLEPDSPIHDGSYKVVKYLYASSGIFDAGSSDEVYWIGYLAYSAKFKELALVFRGTVHASEWQQNADLRAEHATRWIPAVANDEYPGKQILMHQGFCEMYYTDFKTPPYLKHLNVKGQALKKQIDAALVDVLATIKAAEASDAEFAKRPLTLSVTGHSLGGALATVAAYDIIHSSAVAAAWPGGLAGLLNSIQGVTFAQPRVGNEEFARDFNAKITTRKWLRVLNVGDIVPQLPFATLDKIRDVADSIFDALRVAGGYLDIKRERPTKETLRSEVKDALAVANVTKDGVDLALEVTDDLIKYRLDKKVKTTVFEHVGWQMRFDPDDAQFPYIASFGHTSNAAGKFLKATLQNMLAALQLKKFGQQYIEETLSLTDINVRHNINVLIHMVDPTVDKVRMNSNWTNLLPDKLSADERQRLGDRYSWWGPFNNNDMRLVKAADGTYKWTYVPRPDSNGAAKK